MLEKMKVIRYKNRDIIKVDINGRVQGFYRSTGQSSHMLGRWLPFYGILIHYGHGVWFIKGHHTVHNTIMERNWLHRFYTHELRGISTILGMMDIPKGKEVIAEEVNDFLA